MSTLNIAGVECSGYIQNGDNCEKESDEINNVLNGRKVIPPDEKCVIGKCHNCQYWGDEIYFGQSWAKCHCQNNPAYMMWVEGTYSCKYHLMKNTK